MKKRMTTHLLLATTAAIAVACSGVTNHPATAAPAPATDAVAAQLPLPKVPASIHDPHDRATYIVAHFWDSMNFADTTLSHNRDFMEQSFANYVSLFPMVDTLDLSQSVNRLLTMAKADSAAYNLTARIAYKYLYEPNSPMLNEDYYGLFLPKLIGDKDIDEAQRYRYSYQLECIAKNRRGDLAADFSYSDLRGRLHTLRTTDCADQLMVIFFDPECDHCKAAIAFLRDSEQLNRLIADNRATVLAIYAEGDRDQWEKTKTTLPDNWLVGYDRSGIEDNDIYVLRAMPTIYLLDSTKHILLKDALPEAALAAMG
jgi:hypothetical protein